MKAQMFFVLMLLSVSTFSQEPTDNKRVDVISNSRGNEFSPTISADGRIMIFETNKGKKWELYESILGENNQWSEPAPLTSINEKCHFIAGPNLNYDANILYYTAFIEGVTKTEDI